ncbi:MAG: hypothetical protein ACM3KM_04420 [Acidobacteriaceae bacterium]
MLPTSAKTKTALSEAIVSTLSFFHIYSLPLSKERIWELLYRREANFSDVENELNNLVLEKQIIFEHGLYGLQSWNHEVFLSNQKEIERRWTRVKRYFWLLSAIPFVEHMSVINSMAMGNAGSESDIDFFVITKPGRLYFVRSVIIAAFKFLGVYKTREKENEQFCFGFYMASDRLGLEFMLLPEEDPYMYFWLATILPITGEEAYERFISANAWVKDNIPNFETSQRTKWMDSLKPSRITKRILEALCFLPAILLEPALRKIHIRHTFKLPENHWPTSSTIANKDMLKLHALDPRKDLKKRFHEVLQSLR